MKPFLKLIYNFFQFTSKVFGNHSDIVYVKAKYATVYHKLLHILLFPLHL